MFTNRKKDELIQIRVNSLQKDTIKELAKKNKMTIAEYILTLVENDYKKSNN